MEDTNQDTVVNLAERMPDATPFVVEGKLHEELLGVLTKYENRIGVAAALGVLRLLEEDLIRSFDGE